MPERVDPEEIRKFEALAEEWWDPTGRFHPLHRIQPLRIEYIAGRMDLQGRAILDVGCGGGLLAEALALRGARVTGIDRSPKALAVARMHAQKSGVEVSYHESDAQTWAERHSASYDAVTCMEVLEHVPDVEGTIRACAEMLKPGGILFFATLNRTPEAWLKAVIGAEYILGWLPKGTHRYSKFIRPSELHAACRAAGLEVCELRGMSYRFLTNRFELSDDLAVNYLGMARKPA
jgi:ubiquinone biosynthesis O-methyltransferase